MTFAVFSAFWSHWHRHPGQFATLLLGLALATALWSAVQAINGHARHSYAEAANLLTPRAQLHVTARSGGMIPLDDYVALRRAGWRLSPVLEGRTRLGDGFVTILGVDMFTYPFLPEGLTSSETAPAPLELLRPPGVGFAHPHTIARLGLDTDGLQLIPSTRIPVGIVFADIAIADRRLRADGNLSRLVLPPRQPMTRPALSKIAPNLTLVAPDGGPDTDVEPLTDSFHLNLTAFGLLSFAVGLFIVQGMIGLALEQRRILVRSLRVMGLTARHVTLALLTELMGLAVLAGLAGLLLGYVIATLLLPDVTTTLRGLYNTDIGGTLALRPGWVASGLAMAVMGTTLAGAHAVWRMHNLPIAGIAGTEGWAQTPRQTIRWQAVVGTALLGAGLVVLWAFDGLLAGFGFMAGFLIGAALLLPLCLDGTVRLGARLAVKPVPQWVWADMRGQLSGLSTALMALLLAVATNIGVGTMVSSFRLTFTNWLDQRLASELYVTARDDVQGAQVEIWLAERVQAVLPVQFARTELEGQPIRVYGIVDHETYRDHWPLLDHMPRVWRMLADGQAALINEQLARRLNVGPGDPVRFGRDLRLPVAGVYSDYGNPFGQAILSQALLLSHFPDTPRRQFGVRIPPDDVPMIEFTSEPVPSTANLMGMKGCGEAGTVGALAAISNAMQDALWEAGVQQVDMPFTPLKVWELLQ
ncbi:MAG: ABC transporter permease, partial [Rhodobacteraceae bacterium]|nr:ABC transporter permease [Paracoccaceae bacterium]